MQTAHAVAVGNPAEASSTQVRTSGSEHNGMARVVPFSSTQDYTRNPLTGKGERLYHHPINIYFVDRDRQERECRRHYLPMEDICDIADALGRQLTDEDINLLVCFDGVLQKCPISRRQFQPVRWVVVTEKFLDTIHAQGKIVTDGATWRGCFFPDRDRNKPNYVTIAGVPRSWNREGTLCAHWSPLYRFCQKLNGSGVTSTQCAAIIAERTQRQQDFEAQELRMDHTLHELLGKKPVPQRRDRRQFAKPRG